MKSKTTYRLVLVLGLVLVFVAPLGLLVLESFQPVRALVEGQVAQSWLVRVVLDSNVQRGLLTSLGYSLVAVVLGLVWAWPMARILAWNPPPALAVWELVVLAPVMLPMLVTVFGLHRLVVQLGLGDSKPVMIFMLSLYSYPYILRPMQAAYEALPWRMREAALALGASRLRTLLYIETPLVLPAILAGVGVAFLVAFSDVLVVSLFGGGLVPSIASILAPALMSANRGWASALTLVFLAVPGLALVGMESIVLWWRSRRNLA